MYLFYFLKIPHICTNIFTNACIYTYIEGNIIHKLPQLFTLNSYIFNEKLSNIFLMRDFYFAWKSIHTYQASQISTYLCGLEVMKHMKNCSSFISVRNIKYALHVGQCISLQWMYLWIKLIDKKKEQHCLHVAHVWRQNKE